MKGDVQKRYAVEIVAVSGRECAKAIQSKDEQQSCRVRVPARLQQFKVLKHGCATQEILIKSSDRCGHFASVAWLLSQ